MTPEQKPEFRTLIVGLHESYRQDISEALLDIWWGVLEDMELDSVRANVLKWVKSDNQFPPRPGELRTKVYATSQQRREKNEREWRRKVMPYFSKVKQLQRQKAPMQEIEAAIVELTVAEQVIQKQLNSGEPKQIECHIGEQMKRDGATPEQRQSYVEEYFG